MFGLLSHRQPGGEEGQVYSVGRLYYSLVAQDTCQPGAGRILGDVRRQRADSSRNPIAVNARAVEHAESVTRGNYVA